MSSEHEILAALKALAEADREMKASPAVEDRLKFAYRRERSKKIWRVRAAWALAAAAVVVAMVIGVRWRSPKEIAHAPLIEIPRVSEVAASRPVEAAVQRPARVRRPRRQEIVTEFFPLVDAPMEAAALVRVNLPAAVMRTVGLPVREDRLQERVQADVLMSEEGLATAIRFVK